MYSGKIVMNQFITNYSSYEERYEGVFPDGVSKGYELDTSTIYGGEIVETHNITIEEAELL